MLLTKRLRFSKSGLLLRYLTSLESGVFVISSFKYAYTRISNEDSGGNVFEETSV